MIDHIQILPDSARKFVRDRYQICEGSYNKLHQQSPERESGRK